MKHSLDDFQSIPLTQSTRKNDHLFLQKSKNKREQKFLILFSVIILLSFYFFAPLRTNILLLGADFIPGRDQVSRTDSILLMTLIPLKPYVGMLSIPRDLWVTIPGVGENRINTAFFFAEAAQPGSGSEATIRVVNRVFGISVNYYILVKMDGVIRIVNALGGVDIELNKAMGGLTAGSHHLDGKEALAFARERYSGDDFSRMADGQLLIKAIIRKMATLSGVARTPVIIFEVVRSIKTNIPFWLLPRLALATLRTGIDGIDNQVITRDMVTPFVSDGGAQVLAPKWELINPILLKMFGQ